MRSSTARVVSTLAVAVVASVGAALPAMSAVAERDPASPRPTDETVRVVVSYDSVASATTVARSVGRSGKVTRTMRRTPHLVATVPAASVDALRRAPHVTAVQPDVAEPLALDSSLPVIGGDAVHAAGLTGAGTTVAVLDTGVDVDHPFLGGRVVAQYCSSTPSNRSEQSLCPNGTPEDDSADVDGLAACLSGGTTLCDHGTHVAGIAAGDGAGLPGAPTAGVAPGADIIAMQVFTRFTDPADCPEGAPCLASYPSDQINALDRLAALAAVHPDWNVVAANLSLSAGVFSRPCDSDVRKPAVDALLAKGVATVVSAGNDGRSDGVGRPGCISTAVTVGATDDDDTVAGYSNRGPLLDLLAPGSGITSSVPDDDYATFNGTSMAAPHVAGALAVLRGADDDTTVSALVQRLRDTGVHVAYDSGGSPLTTPRIDLVAATGLDTPPVITLDDRLASAPEGGTVTASGTWADPDRDAVTVSASSGTVTQGAGTWTWRDTSGDDASTPVTITATDEDGTTASVAFTATWTNVAPVATLAGSGTTTWNGRSIVLTRTGVPVRFTASATDPGSDDLHTEWTFGDGTVETHTSLVNPPAADPALSLTVQPRSVTGRATHTYAQACGHTLSMKVTDDDGGTSRRRTRPVVVLGTSTQAQDAASWRTTYRAAAVDDTERERLCLLASVRTLSTVFGERRALTTSADGLAVLTPRTTWRTRDRFDAHLVALWLDVAAGSVALSEPLDTQGDGTAETTVGAFLLGAEATRNAVSPTSLRLPRLTSVLRRIVAEH